MTVHHHIITLSCADQLGLVHAVTGFLLARQGNIEEAAQFSDPGTGLFFMRVRFTSPEPLAQLQPAWQAFAQTHGMRAALHNANAAMPTAILVSQQGHCLNDLLFRWRSKLLPIDVRAIISNHNYFADLAQSYGVPFHHVPVSAATKAQAEATQLAILQDCGAQLVVLARYMQILSGEVCQRLAGQAINIHHSFLPSFKGAKPYHQAFDRGVKLIGATAHYVTPDLDEGPIIEQDVARVDHSHDAEALTAVGRDTESQVLARAVKWHSEHRVLLDGHKTVVFR